MVQRLIMFVSFVVLAGCTEQDTLDADTSDSDASDSDVRDSDSSDSDVLDSDTDDSDSSDSGIPDSDADSGVPTSLPIGVDDIISVSTESGLDIYGAMRGDTLIFEHYHDDMLTSGEIWSVTFDGDTPSAPESLVLTGVESLVGSPSIIADGERAWLHSVTAESLSSIARVERRLWEATGLGDPEMIELSEPITLLSWPRFEGLAAGGVIVAYRDPASVVKLSWSEDGVHFGPAQTMGPAGAQPEIGQADDGTLLYTYQVGVGSGMVSYFRSSEDGTTWTEPALVTTSSDNVHDADVFLRRDGRLDLYFIYPDSALGFDLWRRCVHFDGTLGDEELVVVREWGNLAKPRGFRLSDGSIRLTFVEQNTGHHLYSTRLFGDATCP